MRISLILGTPIVQTADFKETSTMSHVESNRREFLAQSVVATLAASVMGTSSVMAEDNSEWAYKMFEKRSHDFGTVARGAKTVYHLKIKNIYENEVHISKVDISCGCTEAKPEKETLKSLEETFISIEMNTTRFEGLKPSSVTVTFDRPLQAKVTIPIQAYIRRDIVLQPEMAQFGALDREDKKEKFTKTLAIQYAGRDDWHIKEVKSNHEHITATVTEKSRASGRVDYELVVDVSPNMAFGNLRQQITLVTDDEKNPHVPVLVVAEMRPDITVSPSIISLGMMQPGQSKSFSLVLEGKKPFSVEEVKCDRLDGVFQVRLPKNPAKVQVIPLTVTAPEGMSTLDEYLSIAIQGRAEPVKLRAYGKIAAKG